MTRTARRMASATTSGRERATACEASTLVAAAPARVPGCAEKAVSEGSVVVGMDGGKLTLQALGSLPATVEQR